MYGQEPGTCDMCQIMGRLHNPQPNRVQSNSGVLLNCSHNIAGVPRGPGDEAMIQPTIGRVYALSL